MTICYFGDFDPNYSRNNVIIKGLQKNSIKVLLCHDNGGGIRKYFNLAKKHRAIRDKYDILIVGYSNSRLPVVLAKLISSKKIIWNPLYSLYDSLILDRHLAGRYSLKGWYYYLLDLAASHCADDIILDTNETIKFFHDKFGVSKIKMHRIFVGADEDIIKPQEIKNEIFTVHFHGHYIPFHGTGVIIRAAKMLEDKPIKFNIVGSGQTYDRDRALAENLKVRNISFIDNVLYNKLIEIMGDADICLGVFGDAKRVDRVIPNKIFEAMAAAKPVITAESKAVKELLEENKSIIFCKKGSPESLAEKILLLYENPNIREELAKNSFAIYNQFATSKAVGKDLAAYLTKLSNE